MTRTLFVALFILVTVPVHPVFPQNDIVRGWNILSDSFNDDLVTLAAARRYRINHLQLSHELVMDLAELRDEKKKLPVNDLIARAHEAGIKEVLVWDHALYDLKYYPSRFRKGPGSTIDLDNPDFWEWFRSDYRELMKLVPSADGIVLTFIETGARAENQYSARLATGAEKLAAVVDAVASVVCDELGKQLYIRTFAYTDAEYQNTIGCIGHIRNPHVKLMMKETPHDFFLTHPNDKYAGTINRPTLIEFDAACEFNGQGVIANTWPEYIIRRWSELGKRPNIIGYVARTDRYGDTRLVGTPNEILLYTLDRYKNDNSITSGKILEEFISKRYGKKSARYLVPAFSSAYEIVSSVLYTLGTNTANHSSLDYDPYKSSYGRHVSGKWLDPPVVWIGHDVNREFDYWKDIIEHLAPARLKAADGPLSVEAPSIISNQMVTPVEKMNEEYLKYIIAEKKYGVNKAEQALLLVEKTRKLIPDSAYNQLHDLFYRTKLTARIHEATATAYFGYRIWAKGDNDRTPWLRSTITTALGNMLSIASEIENFKSHVPTGQWDWKGDAETARDYYDKIAVRGWKEYGGVVFR
ncbi:MAG: hypothetical protein U0X39_03255 [Bacteroidales bacterium]